MVTIFQVLLLLIIYLLSPISHSFLPSKKTDIVESVLCCQLTLLACEVGLAVARLFATSRDKPGHAVLIVPSVRHSGRISMTGTNTENTLLELGRMRTASIR